MLVLEDGVVVSVHADTIREHLLLVVEKSVGTEVLCKIQFLVHHRHRSSSSITGSASVPRHDAVLVAPHVTAKTLEALPKTRQRQRQRQKNLWVESLNKFNFFLRFRATLVATAWAALLVENVSLHNFCAPICHAVSCHWFVYDSRLRGDIF